MNPYHVNIWSPRQWHFVLSQFFRDVDVFLHGIGKIGSGSSSDFEADEESFVIAPGSIADMYRMFTMTAIFVARIPRPPGELPPAGAQQEFIDDSFSRPPGYIDPNVRLRLKRYFEEPRPQRAQLFRRAWTVWRVGGTRTFLRRAGDFVKARTRRGRSRDQFLS
jgi:hypothetical protein